jgi:hypothetical protein
VPICTEDLRPAATSEKRAVALAFRRPYSSAVAYPANACARKDPAYDKVSASRRTNKPNVGLVWSRTHL